MKRIVSILTLDKFYEFKLITRLCKIQYSFKKKITWILYKPSVVLKFCRDSSYVLSTIPVKVVNKHKMHSFFLWTGGDIHLTFWTFVVFTKWVNKSNAMNGGHWTKAIIQLILSKRRRRKKNRWYLTSIKIMNKLWNIQLYVNVA